MFESFTPGAFRALRRAEQRARRRGVASVEPRDLLISLVEEAESRASVLLAEAGLNADRLDELFGDEAEARSASDAGFAVDAGPDVGDTEQSEAGPGEFVVGEADDSVVVSLPQSEALRVVLSLAVSLARSIDRSRLVGTEHLLAGLLDDTGQPETLGLPSDLDLAGLRARLVEAEVPDLAPIPLDGEIPPLELSEPSQAVDLGRILDASANRAREGLRVVEDYVRFALDDPGLTRRIKEVRHRLAEATRGMDSELLIHSRDTKGDVGTHIMTHSERVRENPRAVLSANFKRTQEALRTLEEYGKLVDVWLAGRFEVLRYDVYTLEKLTMTAVAAQRGLGDTRLMVLVGGLPTLGDLTWIVGEALAGGADVIQLREKDLPDREWLSRAREVRILTAQARARFIMNDRPDLARLAGADGVHLGQDDVSVRDARRIIGPAGLIGVSTHDRIQLDAAVLSGAAYLGVGPVFPSPTKEFAEPELAGLSYVQEASEATNLPWFAIGGINEENLERVLEAGATRVAVSSAVVRADRPRTAAARLRARLDAADSA
jgi:thiamine-phosphate pyrophosphorylase